MARDINISLDTLKRIEALAYSSHMQQMQDCDTWQDVAEYAECRLRNLHIWGSDTWYCIVAVHKRHVEIVDVAKIPESIRVPWRHILSRLRKFGISHITCDMRESTSYRLVRILPALGCSVLADETWYWNNERMHAMRLALES